ncbi:hypothetical protein KKA17_02455 [bacterium]|nr:hypothetical protein [bacterium]MBU1883515.1 hypothetical protein [bacterium]
MDSVTFDSVIRNIVYNQEDSKLGVLTEDGNFRVLDENLKTVAGFKTNLPQEYHYRQTQFISTDLKYVVLSKPKTNQAVVFDTVNKKALYTIAKNSGEVETLFINNSDKYLVSGGMDGRTYIFDLKTGHFLYNLPSHTDYVTAITITNTTQLVATGSFDGTIYVTNLSTLKNPIKLIGHDSFISGIEFLNKGKLVSAEKNGNIIIFDFIQRKVKKRLEKVPDDITKIKLDPKREFLFVGTKLGRLLVYDMVNEVLFSPSLHKYTASIMDIFVTNDGILFIALRNGAVYKEKLIDDEKYNAYYEEKNYGAIYKELERSPFVIYTQAYKMIEQKWEEALVVAKELLSQKKIDEAKKILAPFNTTAKKNSTIKTIISEFEEFEKFKYYVDTKKYALAYPLTLKYVSFLDTKEYKKMEDDWSKKFNKAQDVILDPRSDEIVQDLLKDFRGIPSKTKQIQQLLKEKVVFDMFKKRLDSRNYKEIFNYIKHHPFLKELEIYGQLMKYADSCYLNLTKSLSALDFLKVREYLDILEGFEEYESDVKEIQKEVALLIQLSEYCKNNNVIKIYEIIDNLNYDIDLDCVIKMKQKWEKIIDKADTLSYQGDVKGLLELFKSYFIIKSKSTIIKKYILSAYAKKLEYFMKKAGNTNEKIKMQLQDKILKLHEMFGSVEEIKSMLYSFNTFYEDTMLFAEELPERDVSRKEYDSFFG